MKYIYRIKALVTNEEEIVVLADTEKEALEKSTDSNNWIDYSMDGQVVDVHPVEVIDFALDD